MAAERLGGDFAQLSMQRASRATDIASREQAEVRSLRSMTQTPFRYPRDHMQLLDSDRIHDFARSASCTLLLAVGACGTIADPASSLPSRIESTTELESMVTRSISISAQIARPNEDAWRSVTQSIPGFAGTEFDPSGDLVVMLSAKSADQAAAKAAALEILRRTGRPLINSSGRPIGVNVRAVKYTYEELAHWRDEILIPVLDGARASSLDLDESRNAITIGVRDAAVQLDVERLMVALKVPATAYHVEIEGDAVEVSDLGARWRPVMGGVKYGYVLPSGTPTWCTVGIPVIRYGIRGFLAASHCTTVRNTPDYGTAWQPWFNGPAIGSEVFDRVGSSCGYFNSLNCRHADVAMYGLQTLDTLPGEVGFAIGRIARTVSPVSCLS